MVRILISRDASCGVGGNEWICIRYVRGCACLQAHLNRQSSWKCAQGERVALGNVCLDSCVSLESDRGRRSLCRSPLPPPGRKITAPFVWCDPHHLPLTQTFHPLPLHSITFSSLASPPTLIAHCTSAMSRFSGEWLTTSSWSVKFPSDHSNWLSASVLKSKLHPTCL